MQTVNKIKMKNKEQIEQFMKLRSYVLFGASAKKKKFGNMILAAMKKKGYTVYPVHPTANIIDNSITYNSLDQIPQKPEGAIIVLPPHNAERAANEVIAAGIKNIWFQQGSESEKAVRYAVLNGENVISGQCVWMFLKHAGFPHNVHRWVWSLSASG